MRTPAPLLGARPLTVPAKICVAAEVVVTYAQVRWLMSRHDLPSILTRLRRGAQRSYNPAVARTIGLRLAGAVSRTLGPLPVDDRCLARSLVLARMLARRGLYVTLGIGVQAGSEFAAHAWVEQDGRPLLSPLGYEPLVML